MNLKRLRELQESLEVYGDYQQLDEISQKLATKAYRNRATRAFEGQTIDDDESSKDQRKADAALARITRRYGKVAGKHAERAADSNIWGRKGMSWDRRDVGRNQKERKKLNRPKVNEELNIYDILISHLLDEGYADDVKNAYCILENMSEDWVLEILDEAKWIQRAIKHPGAFSKKAEQHDMSPQEFAGYVSSHPEKFGTTTERQANLARTLKKISK